MENPTISTHFLVFLDDLINERGATSGPLLRASNLPPDLLRSAPRWVDQTRYIDFFDRIVRELQWPAAPFDLAARQSIGFLGAIYPLLPRGGTVGGWLASFNRLIQLQVTGLTLTLERFGKQGILRAHFSLPEVQRNANYQAHAVALAVNLIKWLVEPGWQPRAVYFSCAEEARAALFSQRLKAPVAFGAEDCSVRFDIAVLDQPVNAEVDRVPDQLRGLLQQSGTSGIVGKVRYVIQNQLATGQCSASTVAGVLGYPRRTLQRHLAFAGTSFQLLLDDVRREFAANLLRVPGLRMIDIALLLGFADQAVFSRTFRRWMGVAPRQWRQQQG